MRRREFLATAAAAIVMPVSKMAAAAERHLLYIAEPGIRNYVEYGGVGVLVYDIDRGYKFVKRIPTWTAPPVRRPDNVKGVAASATTGRLCVSTISRLLLHRSRDRQGALGRGAGRRLRPPVGHAGRHDALRAVVRRPALERRRCGDRERAPRVVPTPARTTPCMRLDGTHVPTWPGLKSPLLYGRRHKHAYRRRGRPVRSVDPAVHRQRGARRWPTSMSTSCSASRSATSRPGKVLHVEVQGFEKGPVKRTAARATASA